MSTDRVDSLWDRIRSHAIDLKGTAMRILDDIDAGRLPDAAAKADRVEEAAHELGNLLSDQIERRRGQS